MSEEISTQLSIKEKYLVKISSKGHKFMVD